MFGHTYHYIHFYVKGLISSILITSFILVYIDLFEFLFNPFKTE